MSELNVYQRLQKIQQELKAPKGQFNKFGGYAYRSAEDILEAVKPLLDKYDCALYISDSVGAIDAQGVGDVKPTNRFYVTAKVTLVCTDNPNSNLTVMAHAREDAEKKGMDGAQITGAASSYARKYALNGLFCIDDTKDPDATNDHGKQQKPKVYGNGKTKAQAQETAQKGADELHKAKARLARAIDAWSKRSGADAAKAKANIPNRPGYQADSIEFFEAVAQEFEDALAGMVYDEKMRKEVQALDREVKGMI